MPRPRSDIRERIVIAARGCFLEQGVDGASLREIAAAAKTNIGMVYYYFASKDALLEAVLDAPYTAFVRDLEIALAPNVDVEARIERLFQRIARMTPAEYDTARIVIREALVSSPRLARFFRRASAGHIPLLFATVLEGISRGSVKTPATPIFATLLTFAIGFAPQLVRRRLNEALGEASPMPDADLLAQWVFAAWRSGLGGNGKDDGGSRANARVPGSTHAVPGTKSPARRGTKKTIKSRMPR